MFNIIKNHKVITTAIIVLVAGIGVVTYVTQQPEEVTKPKESVEMSVKEEQISEPKEEVVEPVKVEKEITEAVVETQTVEQTEPDPMVEEKVEVVEPKEKLYGTSFGFGCTEDQVFHVHATKFNESIIDLFKSNEVQQGYLWKDTASDRSHCSPNV